MPAATRLASQRIDEETLAQLAQILESMRHAEDPEELVRHDAAFHGKVAATSGNAMLASILAGVSGRTLRARVWRPTVDDLAVGETIAQHEAIYAALLERDEALAEAASLIHVATTESWVRRLLEPVPG